MIKPGTLIRSIWGTDYGEVYIVVAVTKTHYRYKSEHTNLWTGGVPREHFKHYFEVVE